MKKLINFVLASGLLLVCKYPNADSESEALDKSDSRIPIFYVLMKDDVLSSRSDKEIDNWHRGFQTGYEISNFDGANIRSIGRITGLTDYKYSNEASAAASARSILSRYLVVRYEDGADIDAILLELRLDPNVEYVSVDALVEVSAACSDAGSSITSYAGTSKTWGRNAIQATQGWDYSTGHAYIGMADLGVQMNHPDLKDFNGNTYLFGNFHPHLSFDVGNRSEADGGKPNPYSGWGVFQEVDEYHSFAHPEDALNCDAMPNGNHNGYNESSRAGHGTAVFGVIGANSTNSDSAKGVCQNCPISIAKIGYTSQCSFVGQPFTGQPTEAFNSGITQKSTYSGTAFLIDIGAQVINLSSGIHHSSYPANYCSIGNNYLNPICLTIQYAKDRDVVVVAAAGNDNEGYIDWPASDSRVIGVAGRSQGGPRWVYSSTCGTNYGGTSDTNGPSFVAPAESIYTTMYADMDYHELICHEWNDDNGSGASELGDGFGYCSGTSLASPFVSSIAGLLRSVNPLFSRDDVYDALKASTGTTWATARGWGLPRIDIALKEALGVVAGVQVRNRAIPLFNLYSQTGKDYINTTKPQIVLAFTINSTLNVDSDSASAIVTGFTFAESPDNPSPPTPRADAFLLSTHYPVPAGKSIIPLYRMRRIGPHGNNPKNTDWLLVKETEISSFRSNGYLMDGMEGYIYAACTPEPTCIPPGAVKLYRAYKATQEQVTIADHAVFPQSRYSAMTNAGYNLNITKLGYTFPNQDSDGDGLVDGLEILIGTNVSDTDSDNDGFTDSQEYPLARLPQSDPGN